MIEFVFNERKTAQAAARLLKLHGGKMDYRLLLNLMYLADRQALTETGLPISGDSYVSMDLEPA